MLRFLLTPKLGAVSWVSPTRDASPFTYRRICGLTADTMAVNLFHEQTHYDFAKPTTAKFSSRKDERRNSETRNHQTVGLLFLFVFFASRQKVLQSKPQTKNPRRKTPETHFIWGNRRMFL
jgi:hypothetical protein